MDSAAKVTDLVSTIKASVLASTIRGGAVTQERVSIAVTDTAAWVTAAWVTATEVAGRV